MKASRGFSRWAPLAGGVVVGVLALSFSLEGAPTKSGKRLGAGQRTTPVSDADGNAPQIGRGGLERAALPGGSGKLSAGSFKGLPIPESGMVRVGGRQLPVAPTVTVDPYDDEPSKLRREGKLVGPWRPGLAGVAAGGCPGNTCSFNNQCDDCNPCTDDLCDIDVGGGDGLCGGTCINTPTPNGQGAAACSDGVFCNGLEVCMGGVCQAPGAGTGIPADQDDQVPCDGVCDIGARAARRCGCPGGPAGPGGVCNPTTCLGGMNNGLACPGGQADCPGGTCQGICAGGLDNGEACNPGLNCPGGTCINAACSEDDGCIADCEVRRCSSNSANAGAFCTSNANCTAGTCNTNDQNCNDGLTCTGIETCDPFVNDPDVGNGNVCFSTGNNCGFGADCSELTCNTNLPGPPTVDWGCFEDADCSGNQVGRCADRDEVGCLRGRCCEGVNNATCLLRTLAQCTDPTDQWFATTDGGIPSPVAPASLTCINLEPDVICPVYSSGIVNIGGADPTFGPTVGPIQPFAKDGPAGPLCVRGDDYNEEFGDDYLFAGAAAYVEVELLVWAGGVETAAEERVVFEFRAADGAFIEDIFVVTGSGLAVRPVRIEPPVTLPAGGYVVAGVATAFSPNGRVFWTSTDSADVDNADVGTNDPVKVWRNGAPDTSNVIGECTGGTRDGLHCDPGGVPGCPGGACTDVPDVLAFELAGDPALNTPNGACCASGGACTTQLSWVCNNTPGSTFIGLGSDCFSCSADSPNSGAACTVVEDCRQCTAGPEFGVDCAVSADCTGNGSKFCVGGVNNGVSCLVNADCPGGVCTTVACLGTCEAACALGACCNPANGNCTRVAGAGACAGGAPNFLGFGTDCDPNCCEVPPANYTGGDDCQDAIVHVIPVPTGLTPNVVTITGDNTPASLPDTCTAAAWDPLENNPDDVDRGWWQAFSINDCAFVRIDNCCTDPIHAPQYRFLYSKCPCEEQGSEFILSTDNPNNPLTNTTDDTGSSRGAPFCDDDNLWRQYGPLKAGTYYEPVYSALAGHNGQYQMHITVEACPDAACCYQTCVGGPTPGAICDRNSDCGAGTCNTQCALLNILECQDNLGYYQGPPNEPTANPACGSTCDTGSCCTSPGVCVDDLDPTSTLNPVDNAECDTLGGIYRGNVLCAGGTCGSGTNSGGSCNDATDCPGCTVMGGGCCNGSAAALAQRNPCPACEIAGAAFCQRGVLSGFSGARLSDDCVADCTADPENGGIRVADDFRASETGNITTICVQGEYLDQGPGGLPDCYATGNPNKEFTVKVYNDNSGTPGTLVGNITSSTTIIGEAIAYIEAGVGGRNHITNQLSLNTPIPVVANQVYWLEVVANTIGSDPHDGNCDWFWDFAETGQANEWAYQNEYGNPPGPGVYNPDDALTVDLNWCMNLQKSTPATPVRACCTCADNVCQELTFNDCVVQLKGAWFFDEIDCAGFVCSTSNGPANDSCSSAIAVNEADVLFETFCADSSPSPLDLVDCGDVQATNFDRDIWYKYTATCTGEATVSLCDPAREGFDEVLVMYTDETATCPCPTTSANQMGLCNDDGCVFSGAGSELTRPVTAGRCYTIRIGGFNDAQGRGHLTITCNEPLAPPPPVLSGNDVCNGGANNGLPCGQVSDCPGGQCGTKNRFLSFVQSASGTASAGPTLIRVKVVDVPSVPWLPGALATTIEGDIWWAGAPAVVNENPAPGPTLKVAPLVCAPPAPIDWTTHGLVHLYGAAITPGTRYEIANCLTTAESTCSAPIVIVNPKHGDVVAPFLTLQPNFQDISAMVAKFQAQPGAISKSRAQMQPNVLNPANNINFLDISAVVGAFQGNPYGFAGNRSCP